MVEKSPDSELFRFSLGQALYEEGSSAEAIEHLQACCEKKNEWMVPRILLGKALLDVGRTTEARQTLETALHLAVEQNHEAPEAELRMLLAELPAE